AANTFNCFITIRFSTLRNILTKINCFNEYTKLFAKTFNIFIRFFIQLLILYLLRRRLLLLYLSVLACRQLIIAHEYVLYLLELPEKRNQLRKCLFLIIYLP